DDLAVIDDEHGGQRHAGADLAGERVDGEDVIHRRLLLPATAAHDRVHRELSLCLVWALLGAGPAPIRAGPHAGPERYEGAACLSTRLAKGPPPRIHPVRKIIRRRAGLSPLQVRRAARREPGCRPPRHPGRRRLTRPRLVPDRPTAGSLASGSPAPGSPAPGSPAPGSPASGSLAPGPPAPGPLASGPPASG